jgi:hypothetical protein
MLELTSSSETQTKAWFGKGTQNTEDVIDYVTLGIAGLRRVMTRVVRNYSVAGKISTETKISIVDIRKLPVVYRGAAEHLYYFLIHDLYPTYVADEIPMNKLSIFLAYHRLIDDDHVETACAGRTDMADNDIADEDW